MDLRSTLNLPDPDFSIPMKADLPQREPEIQRRWDEQNLYHLIQASRQTAPAFVLHDGPPYTNSPIHIGTALNKILKDFVVKSRTMMGYRAPYVPGFDNHGLPIEQAVMRKFHEQKIQPDIVQLRTACREHASHYLGVQTAQFKRLGVTGLWERPYATMDFGFEAEIVRVFKRLVEGGYVYKGLRPTLWSPTSRTALADTEIVYADHVSRQIYVRFPLFEDPNRIFEAYSNLYTVIWTTTPWTIPANLAVAFHPELSYAVARVGDDHYLLLEALLPKVAEIVGWDSFEVVARLEGVNFGGARFKHPIFDRPSVAVLADYVTTEDGTGVVHTAPGHGRDDFYTGLKNDLPILCPVDERGVLTDEAGEFAGTFYKDCDTVVVERLKQEGHLLYSADYSHSYPHAERDGQPVIFRATEQWFVGIDHNDLRQRMLSQIQHVPVETLEEQVRGSLWRGEDATSEVPNLRGVTWVPESGYARIEAMVRNRPDWCISRQRPWGVGIPIFYGLKSGKPVLDSKAIESVAQLVEREGSDAWFVKEPSEILPVGYSHPETGETEFRKETDVLDVWFDSGSTSLCVLEGNVEPAWQEHWPADLYLEGSDQHRGWFNSSLVIGVATRGDAPYRQVLTHGFVVDEKGFKMSKRLGNVVDPEKACDMLGADIVRYWVASVDYAHDVPCSEALLKTFGEHYRRVRNTFRFLLGNLYDYQPEMAPAELLDLDRWIVEQTDLLVSDCVKAYRAYDFARVVTSVHNFCVNELSSFYLDAIKDRMYCDGTDWPSRRSGQAACHYVLLRLVKLMAPVLVHTSEEVYARIPGIQAATVHAETFDVPSQERIGEIAGSNFESRFAALLSARAWVFGAFEQYKGTDGIKDSQDVIATLAGDAEWVETLRSFGDELPNLFKMSGIELVVGEAAVAFRPSPYAKCARSRLRRPDVQEVDGTHLTARDRKVLGV
jgi:isoleucyl-tRNA synthetase